MDVKLVIFDFDGVIVNTEDIFLQVLHDELEKIGIKVPFEKMPGLFTGHNTIDVAKELVAKHKNATMTAVEFVDKINNNRDTWIKAALPMPNIENLIKSLKVPYCIASNSGLPHIYKALEIIKLKQYFDNDRIFSAFELGKFKPNPAVYLHALKTMGIEAKNALAIEDSVPGLTAAHAAKIPVIGFLSNSHIDKDVNKKLLTQCGAFTTVENLKEVQQLLES